MFISGHTSHSHVGALVYPSVHMRAHTYTRTLICGEPLARVDSYSLTLKKRRQAGREELRITVVTIPLSCLPV